MIRKKLLLVSVVVALSSVVVFSGCKSKNKESADKLAKEYCACTTDECHSKVLKKVTNEDLKFHKEFVELILKCLINAEDYK